MKTIPNTMKLRRNELRAKRKRVIAKPVAVPGKAVGSKAVRGKTLQNGSDNANFRVPVSVTREALLDDNGHTDHKFRQMLYDFSVLGASLEIARAHLASSIGLTSPQYNITMVIANLQGAAGIRVSDVAMRLHVSTAFVTSEAGKLEQMGLVKKRPNPSDGRGVLLRLTAKGEATVRQVSPLRQRMNDRLFASMSEKSFRNLAGTLSQLLDDFSDTIRMLEHGIVDGQRSA